MKKNIYMLLNDVSTDTSGYPDTELTEAELKKYRENMRKKIGKKRRKVVYTAVAFAACLVLIATLIYFRPMQQQMRASTGSITNTLSAMLGVPNDLEEHVLHIEKAQRMEDMTVTLNTVAADEGELIVYTTQVFDDAEAIPRFSEGYWSREYDAQFDGTTSFLSIPVQTMAGENPGYRNWNYEDRCIPVQRLYINGEERNCSVTGEGTVLQKGVMRDVARYNLPISDLTFPADVKIEIYRNAQQDQPGAVFEFTLEENMVIPDIKDVPLDYTVELPNGEQITITRFTYSVSGMKVFGTYKEGRSLEENAPRVLLSSKEVEGITQFFKEVFISEKESVFLPDGNVMYERVATLDKWELEVNAYYYSEDEGMVRRQRPDTVITIPLQ